MSMHSGKLSPAVLISILVFASAGRAQAADECRDRLAAKGLESGRQGVYDFVGSYTSPSSYAIADPQRSAKIVDLIAQISEALEKRGTTLVMVPVPPKPVVMSQYLSPDSKVQNGYAHAEVQQLYASFVEKLSVRGVVAVDALTPLKEFDWSQTPELPNMANERHWSATGARLSAEAVARRLASTEKYRSLPKVPLQLRNEGYKVSPATPEHGIGKLLMDLCGLELRPEKVPQVSVEDAEVSLFSDVVPRVMLVGTSYSSDTFSFDEFLASSLQQRVMKLAAGGAGMFGGIERALSEGHITSEIHYLVWEFPFLDLSSQVSRPEYILSALKQLVAVSEADCMGLGVIAKASIGPPNYDMTLDLTEFLGSESSSDYLIIDVDEPVGEFRIFAGTDTFPLLVVQRNSRAQNSSGRYFFKLAEDHLPRTALRVAFSDPNLVEGKTITVGLCGGRR